MANTDGADEGFGDDFDDFEEGDEGADFDDFDDGFQEPEEEEMPATPASPPSSAPAIQQLSFVCQCLLILLVAFFPHEVRADFPLAANT